MSFISKQVRHMLKETIGNTLHIVFDGHVAVRTSLVMDECTHQLVYLSAKPNSRGLFDYILTSQLDFLILVCSSY